MTRPLSSFPLPSGHLARLSTAGFDTAEDLKDVGIVELSKELDISHSDALEVLQVVTGRSSNATTSAVSTSSAPDSLLPSHNSGSIPAGRSALELLKAEQLQGHIVTFCARVDSMLGGGVPMGKITEFCGAPGTGKTQLGMQLAVDVRIPEVLGGVGGEAVYIDTEGSFIVERVADIAAAAVQHLSSVAESSEDHDMQEAAREFTVESVLSGIHYFRCHDYLELVALVNLLPEFVSGHPKVRLVVVDSIASPFRHDFEDMVLRNRILSGLAQSLIKMATQSSIAVVLTNQMTTKFTHRGSKSGQLVPALGESWGHASTIRVVLFWSGSERYATLYKSPNRKEVTIPFQVTQHGVRDATTPSSQDPLSQLASLSSSQMEDFELSHESGADVAELEQSWDSGGDDITANEFVTVSELHQPNGRAATNPRKRLHPGDLQP